MEPFLGEIRLFSYNKSMRGWLPCDGAIMQIAQNQALFAVIGAQFGGDGKTTFAVPDLRGRAPVAPCNGILTDRIPVEKNGNKDGAESVVLTSAQVPIHTHAATASSAAADQQNPASNRWATVASTGAALPYAASTVTPNSLMNGAALSSAGSSGGHTNMQPYTVLRYYIATQGLFPPRPW